MSATSSLTAPWDKTGSQTVQKLSRPLSDKEAEEAVAELSDTTLIKKFPQTERFYADPIYNNQMYCLHSFVPSKNATPDEHGVFGFMKCRGAFHNIEEANDRAEWIIRNVDSYHSIQTGYSGKPFPVCHDFKEFVAETHEVDIRKKAIETLSEDIKRKKEEERRDIADIREGAETVRRGKRRFRRRTD